VDSSCLRLRSFSATREEAAEQQSCALEDDNTDSDVEGAQQRCRDGEGEARVDASNDEEHDPAHGRRWNHNSPPSAKNEAHKQQRRNHTSSVLRVPRGRGETMLVRAGARVKLSTITAPRPPPGTTGDRFLLSPVPLDLLVQVIVIAVEDYLAGQPAGKLCRTPLLHDGNVPSAAVPKRYRAWPSTLTISIRGQRSLFVHGG
jgi:hypothetical protein